MLLMIRLTSDWGIPPSGERMRPSIHMYQLMSLPPFLPLRKLLGPLLVPVPSSSSVLSPCVGHGCAGNLGGPYDSSRTCSRRGIRSPLDILASVSER